MAKPISSYSQARRMRIDDLTTRIETNNAENELLKNEILELMALEEAEDKAAEEVDIARGDMVVDPRLSRLQDLEPRPRLQPPH